jgi:hypothetical protein
MFAIGTEGAIVPNVLIQVHNGKRSRSYNPTEIILNACSSCIEMNWCCRSKELRHSELKDLMHITNISSAHSLRAFSLKQALSKSNKMRTGIKGHAWCHNPEDFAMFGDHEGNDTVGHECDHKEDKKDFNQTSKRFKTVHTEMLYTVSINLAY